ncbi:MAG: hypothetical protein ACYDCQ_06855 [Dehalococcoidia bacterium]
MGSVRDVVIIIWGVTSIATLVVVMLIALFIGLSVKNLINTVNDLINTGVKPVIETSQQTVTNVTGTAQFLGDAIVSPIIRLFSLIAGIRRGVAVFTGVTGKLRRADKGEGGR